MFQVGEKVLLRDGSTAVVLEAKQRRRGPKTVMPRFDYLLGVRLQTGAWHRLGWYYDEELQSLGVT